MTPGVGARTYRVLESFLPWISENTIDSHLQVFFESGLSNLDLTCNLSVHVQ